MYGIQTHAVCSQFLDSFIITNPIGFFFFHAVMLAPELLGF